MVDGSPRRTLASLLDEEPDLGEGIAASEMPAARRRSITPVIAVAPPTWDTVAIASEADEGWLGLMVLDGLIARRVTVGSRAGCELCARGDLVRPWDTDGDYAPLPVDVDWLVLTPARLAVIDADFVARTAAWPVMHSRIVGRAAQRARYLALTAAVTHLPRVHARLLLLLWLLAERSGTVTPRGVTVTLPATHDMLAMLVGARRPTVSLALAKLNRAGLVIRERSDRWLLTHRALDILQRADDLDLAGLAEFGDEEPAPGDAGAHRRSASTQPSPS